MSSKKKNPPIYILGGLKQMTDGVLGQILDATLKGLTANAAAYPKPPIDLTTYGNSISAYESAIPAALDGSKTAKAQKNKLKTAAIKQYEQQGKYVEAACNDDMATFLLSGFQPKTTTRSNTPPASNSIRKLERSPSSGEIDATLMRVTTAASYELRFAPVPAPAAGSPGTPAAAPTTWTVQAVATVKAPVKITNLTPGTTYAFQARALLKTGDYTPWSDSVTLMCA